MPHVDERSLFCVSEGLSTEHAFESRRSERGGGEKGVGRKLNRPRTMCCFLYSFKKQTLGALARDMCMTYCSSPIASYTHVANALFASQLSIFSSQHCPLKLEYTDNLYTIISNYHCRFYLYLRRRLVCRHKNALRR